MGFGMTTNMLTEQKLYNCDCMEYMKNVKDNSISFTLTDIPYNAVNRNSNGLRDLNKLNADMITFDLNNFITKKIDAKYLKSIVMITDGVSDDIKPNLRIDFAKSISEECYQNSSRKNNAMLKKMLIEWPVPKHSDDKTIIVIINKTRFQEEKK